MLLEKQLKRYRRHRRVRAKIRRGASPETPRLCVFRSSKHIYCQLIDDIKGRVIESASDFELKKPDKKGKGKKETKASIAFKVGELIAKKALAKKITKIVFDRAGYKYHGRVKALTEGARKGGLKF